MIISFPNGPGAVIQVVRSPSSNRRVAGISSNRNLLQCVGDGGMSHMLVSVKTRIQSTALCNSESKETNVGSQ